MWSRLLASHCFCCPARHWPASRSDISRHNRFTAHGLATVLTQLAPHADLLRGHDGGMNKTGTMDGIRALVAMLPIPRVTDACAS